MELPVYMLLQDPHHEEYIFICRTQPPILVGQVVKGDINALVKKYNPIAVGQHRSEKGWAVFLTAQLDGEKLLQNQETADKLAKIMREMSDYYIEITE